MEVGQMARFAHVRPPPSCRVRSVSRLPVLSIFNVQSSTTQGEPRTTRGERDHHLRWMFRNKHKERWRLPSPFPALIQHTGLPLIESQQVVKMELSVMATFICDVCQREMRFLSLQNSMRSAGVCRSTIYYWMERGWIHWRELPSGSRMICYKS